VQCGRKALPLQALNQAIVCAKKTTGLRLSISSGVVCIEVGKLFYKRTMLPCARINSVKYSENAADRLFGHARLTIVSTTLTTELEPLDKFDAQYIEEQLTRR
uniref:PH domain-containing protein n=1 Tax=Arcanobacterium phocae TaxID=131112 RepID=UPI001C0F3BEB